MVNVTVIRIKDTFKYLVGIIILLIILFILTRFFSNKKINKEIPNINISSNMKTLEETWLDKCFDDMFISRNVKENKKTENNSKKIIETEIIAQTGIKESNNQEEQNIEEQPIQEETKQEVQQAQTDVTTEVLDTSNINTKYTNTYNTVKIKNETEFELTEDMLTPNIELANKKDILIFHTHTCESYTKTEQNNYEETGNFRTTDLNYSVSRVGDELETYLKTYGYNVFHDKTFHDYPAYSGSYNRSLKTVQSYLSNSPNTQIVIDLHRDAVGANSTYKPVVRIGEDYCAQLMFVIGTNGGGLTHPNWVENLKFAIKIQEKANEMYPGLMKPIILRNSRYNQHVTNAACIIEVGATGNTLEESMESMKYLSNVINETLK